MKLKLWIILLLIGSIYADHRPNILYMMSDDQAWNGLSAKMHPDNESSKSSVIQTPVLEKLATEGMRFSKAYAPSPVCSPTRISFQTGLSPAVLHWTRASGSVTAVENYPMVGPKNIRAIAVESITIGELLKASGYMTAHYGKWHINGGGPGEHGYDEHDGDIGNEVAENYHDPNPADVFGMAERALGFMKKAKDRDKPFFIQMSYHALHAPLNASAENKAKYAKLMPGGNEKEIGRAAISEDLDRSVGEVLKALDRLGLAKNTYVIYTSDNGAGGKRGPLRGGKGDVWEGGIRVPLIVRGPGVESNSWCHETVVGYDWYPTFCRWAGIKNLPEALEGGDLSKLLESGQGKVERVRGHLVFHFPHYQGDSPHTALLWENYKLIKFYESGQSSLYDLNQDLAETHDLSQTHKHLHDELHEKMEQYLIEVNAQMATKNPEYDPSKPTVPKKGGKLAKNKNDKPKKNKKKK
jgi:arylsulfatase A-like enzyme